MAISLLVRQLTADKLLIENIRTLLHRRGDDQEALARWCGHKAAWLSKILDGDRGVRIKDLGRIADFFGLRVDELFAPSISPLTERRRHQRRSGVDRRQRGERRHGRTEGALHPDVSQRFPDPPAPRG